MQVSSCQAHFPHDSAFTNLGGLFPTTSKCGEWLCCVGSSTPLPAWIFFSSNREKRLFSLKGRARKGLRVQIYKFLLEHFTDEQRFNITSKISQNVLGTAGASEGSNPKITCVKRKRGFPKLPGFCR